MLGVVGLKLIAGFETAALVRGVELYEDGANLTRLYDFFKVKVAYLASAWCGTRGGYAPDERLAARIPHRSRNRMFLKGSRCSQV